MGVTWVSLGGPNPIQSVPNPIQPGPNPIQIRSMGGPWPLQVGSGSVHSHSKSDPDGPWPLHVGSGWSRPVGNHRKPSQTIRNHPKSSERKPTGLSIVQAKCVALLYLFIYLSIYLLTFPSRRLHTGTTYALRPTRIGHGSNSQFDYDFSGFECPSQAQDDRD